MTSFDGWYAVYWNGAIVAVFKSRLEADNYARDKPANLKVELFKNV